MDNIVLLGHGIGIKLIIQSFKKNPELNLKVKAVVTHPYEEHSHDLQQMKERDNIYEGYSYNVFDLNNDDEISLLESDDVNDEETVKWIKELDPRYIISVGCRNILKPYFLDIFYKKVINVHTTPLPKYRGAASDTWMILNGEWGTKQYGCMHFIDEGIDTGDIIAKEYYKIPERCYPIDIFKKRMDLYSSLVPKGLNKLNSEGFKPIKQDSSKATTFPRLFTPKDGRVDFKNFAGNEIIRFIHAFGYPYEGAHVYLSDKKVNILEAEFFEDNRFHSFANGLIFGKSLKSNAKVVVNGGYIIIKKIEVNGDHASVDKILKVGRFLS